MSPCKGFSFVEPSFVLGCMIGIGLSSLLFQSLFNQDPQSHSIGTRQRRELPPQAYDEQPSNYNIDRNSFGDYEVHNIGLGLKSHDQYSSKYDFDFKVKRKKKNNFPNYPETTYLEDERFLREVGGRQLVHTMVLASTADHRYKQAIQETWSDRLSHVQYIQPKDVSIQGHLDAGIVFHALQELCAHSVNSFHWFVIVDDKTYIHSPGLVESLRKISPSAKLLIGVPRMDNGDVCSLDHGLVMSQKLLSSVCPRLEECQASGQAHLVDVTVAECVVKVAAAGCTNSSQISIEFQHLASDWKQIVDESMLPTDKLGFLGPVTQPNYFYKLHLQFVHLDILQTQKEISRLGQELAKSSTNNVPSNHKEPFISKESEGTQPFYEFIDSSGKIYTESCQVKEGQPLVQRRESEGKSSYESAKKLAYEKTGIQSFSMENFSFRIHKPNIGYEYKFFFIERKFTKKNPANDKGNSDRVHQVTVVQPYGQLGIVSKEIQKLEPIHFVVPITDKDEHVMNFLESYERVCLNENSNFLNCSLLVLFFQKEKGVHSEYHRPVHTLLNVLQSKRLPGVIKTIEVMGETYTIPRTIQMADTAFGMEDLIAFLTPDTHFSETFIYWCQLNAIRDKQIYFPVTFQHYNESLHIDEISQEILDENGFWAYRDYSKFCVYNSDIHEISHIPESYDELYRNINNAKELSIFRIPDPALMKAWPKQTCQEGSETERVKCMTDQKYANLFQGV